MVIRSRTRYRRIGPLSSASVADELSTGMKHCRRPTFCSCESQQPLERPGEMLKGRRAAMALEITMPDASQ
jgi:hypothetical protein